MAHWWFTARQRFMPSQGKDWHSYVQFSGFTHITELVTLDSFLCPDLVENLIDEDWAHNVQVDFRITWFTDFDYARQRVVWRPGKDQLLAVYEQPARLQKVSSPFEFCGFDIVDGDDGNSVLTNCGRFPQIFMPLDVNQWGLLSDLGQANDIAEKIRASFPEEPHCCRCRVWQIARFVPLV
ncbi:MAG: hypothetical protein ACFB2W_27110 [Leptolyngbyaceae cyanobacterium]